jgi:hypothetical protein
MVASRAGKTNPALRKYSVGDISDARAEAMQLLEMKTDLGGDGGHGRRLKCERLPRCSFLDTQSGLCEVGGSSASPISIGTWLSKGEEE